MNLQACQVRMSSLVAQGRLYIRWVVKNEKRKLRKNAQKILDKEKRKKKRRKTDKRYMNFMGMCVVLVRCREGGRGVVTGTVMCNRVFVSFRVSSCTGCSLWLFWVCVRVLLVLTFFHFKWSSGVYHTHFAELHWWGDSLEHCAAECSGRDFVRGRRVWGAV